MFAITVEFLQGVFRGDPDGTANTGNLTRGEWPPAPARLFAAFVAADGTRGQCRVTDGTELEWFERLPPPVIRADTQPWQQTLLPRYVVEHQGSASEATCQEYVGRKSVPNRPGVRVTPRHPRVIYFWDVEVAPESTLGALRRRAARIGYLGTADSPVRIRVTTRMPESVPPEGTFVHHPEGELMINVPAPGDVAILDRMYDTWCERGADVSRSHFPALSHEVAYRTPNSAASDDDNGTVVAWLRLARPISGRRITMVTDLFKQAVLSHHQDLFGEPPNILHGHGFSAKGYDIARFLALPDVGFPHSSGRIHGLALWMPPGSDPTERQRACEAGFAVRRLTSEHIDVAIVRQYGNRPFAASPERWTRRSRGWTTAFPAIHERRGVLDLAEVSRWCEHAGLPAPVRFRTGRMPLVKGAVDLAPVEVNRAGRTGRPYSHVELHFSEPVSGPVVIGHGRQRGFGLCVPIDED